MRVFCFSCVVSQVLVNRSWSNCCVRTYAETEMNLAQVSDSPRALQPRRWHQLCCLPSLPDAVKNPYLVYDLIKCFVLFYKPPRRNRRANL